MNHRLKLEVQIDVQSIVHAGSGEGSFLTDRLIVRDSRGRPYIPASTLKGVFREHCERLSRTLGFPAPADPHQPNLTQHPGFVPKAMIDSPVDILFGTKYEAGELYFRNAEPIGADWPTTSRHRVARHRVLGTAREKHLFSTEYANDTTFRVTIDGYHHDLVIFDEKFPPFAYCLLIAGILSVESLGGDKSTGAGRLTRPIQVAALYNGDPVDIDGVFDLLSAQDYLEMRGES